MQNKNLNKLSVDLSKVQEPTTLDKETWEIKNEIYAEISKAERDFKSTQLPILAIEEYVAEHLAKKGYKKVVMCCDCKYCEVVIDSIIDEPKWFCTRMVGCIPVDPTDYCSRAKMKGAE